MRLTLLGLLLAAGLLTVFSRHVPALADDAATRWAIVLGAILAAVSLFFLYAVAAARTARDLLLAVAGTLSVAALNAASREFFVLAAVCGLALWAYAVLTGGPQRRGRDLVLFASGCVALAVATVVFLPWAATRVTRFIAQSYSDGLTGLSDTSELGEVERLGQSRKVVARVWTSAPRLMRMQVFDHFDGRRWSVGPRNQRSVDALADDSGAGFGPLLNGIPGRTFRVIASDSPAGRVETRVVPVMDFNDGWGLLVPASSDVLRLPDTSLKVDDLGRVFAPNGFPQIYGVAGPVDSPALARSEPGSADLQLPRPVNPAVQELADKISARGVSDDDRVDRTVNLLRSRPYRYTLAIGSFETDDPVAEFLLRKKAGYCEYFASAAVVLLRAQGIPARYVKGVRVRPESFVGGHYVVRESDAHAWIEAYVAGRGWVEEDPTPPGDYSALHAESAPGPFDEVWESLRGHVAAAWAMIGQGSWAGLGVWLSEIVGVLWRFLKANPLVASAVLLVFALSGGLRPSVRWIRRWLSRRRQRASAALDSPTIPSELIALLRHVERLWMRRGHSRPPTRGLREHLDVLPREALTQAEREATAAVVDCYYRVSFGRHAPSSESLSDLQTRIASLR
jgi:transglutaminase-like putative cysteine protease